MKHERAKFSSRKIIVNLPHVLEADARRVGRVKRIKPGVPMRVRIRADDLFRRDTRNTLQGRTPRGEQRDRDERDRREHIRGNHDTIEIQKKSY